MPICEADPWRLQYFAGVPCPPGVNIPTEDADAWLWQPRHRWVYDKLAVALSQRMEAAPHGVEPTAYPVFSKPIVNLRGMGIDSRAIASASEYQAAMTPGHFWMEKLAGEHVSSDAAVLDGVPAWWRHAVGIPGPGGTFDHWIVEAARRSALEGDCGGWIARHLDGYTGMVNLETIGGRIIEVHLRFADQWPDLYGAGWVEALIALHAEGRWEFADADRATGYSVVLFGPKHLRYRHPDPAMLSAVRGMAGVSSVQITFHEDRETASHAMPPGGFRLAIVNATGLEVGLAAREVLWAEFSKAGALPLDPAPEAPGSASS